METEPYIRQESRVPQDGRVILADFDADHIVVYQAYKPQIATWAVQHQQLGGSEFSFGRMSWIKTSFLWMMYRSDWATGQGQERILSIRVVRPFFEELVARAVPSHFTANEYRDVAEWREAVAHSDVRVQWDPDRDPDGNPLARRAIQLGLRGDALARFARGGLTAVEDVTPFVRAQHERLRESGADHLRVPVQRVYPMESGRQPT